MDRNERFARNILGWVCAGHLLTGLLAFVSGDVAIRIGMLLYGASFEPSDQFVYIIRPLGVYMIGFAALQWQAYQDPRRYRHVIDATLGVMFLRQFQRIVYAPDIFAAFGIPPGRHWFATGVFLATAFLLLAARLQLDSPAEEPPVIPRAKSAPDATTGESATAAPSASPSPPVAEAEPVVEPAPAAEEAGVDDEPPDTEPAQEAVFEVEESAFEPPASVTSSAPGDVPPPAGSDDEEAV